VRLLEPRREMAERDIRDTTSRLEAAQAQLARATSNLAAVQSATDDPGRFMKLMAEFMTALQGGRPALDAFLRVKEDANLRGLIFGIRADAEFKTMRERKDAPNG